MSFYDEENPFLARPRPFWEEEEPVVAPVVAAPVAPPAAPPPEVEGPGYASLEDIPVAEAPPEVEGPGYASLEEIPEEQPPPPEVEGPGYASLEEIPEPEEESFLGKAARLGYRTLAAPFTQPIETIQRGTEALREGVIAPTGTRRREFVERFERNLKTSVEETKAAAHQMAAGLLRGEQNPYVGKSAEQAKVDIPLLEQQIVEGEKSLTALGGNPEFVGQEWSLGADLTPEQREQSQKLGALQQQLARAKEASTGPSTESPAGTISRSFEDVAAENRDRKAEIVKEYGDLIDQSHDKELWMQVADSLGSSAPSMVGSMMNPLFGLSLMYAQTFETARAEYLEKGGDPAKADEVGHAQAITQTPLEVLGELPIAGIAKGALKRLASEANPESWAKWIGKQAVELGKAFVGEVGATTPGQTVIEQKIGEAYGYKPVKTWGELGQDVVEAQKVAAMQTLLAGGGPVAAEAALRTVGGVSAPAAPVVSPAVPGAVPPAGAVPSPIPPTPDEAFAPGVTIEPAPSGEVPGEALAPPPIAPFQPGQQVHGLEEGAAPGTVTGVQDGSVMVDWGDGMGPQAATPSALKPVISPESAAKTVVSKVQSDNAKIEQTANVQAQNLQASAAPKTAQAIQQVAQASNTEASVTAAEFLRQAQAAAAEGATGAAPAEAQAQAPAAKEAPAAAPAQAPQPAQAQAETPAVVVGGQQFTGETPADAVQAAHQAVGDDAMDTATTGWIDPESGKFVSHEVFDAYQNLNTAREQAGGNMEAPAVREATARMVAAQARDEQVNSQIVSSGGEQVVQTGVKGQQAVIAVRPSQELAQPLAGVTVEVEGITPEGQRATEEQPAAQALVDARNDRSAFTVLLNCLI